MSEETKVGKIEKALKANPDLMEFVATALTWTPEEVKLAISMLSAK
jgi:hypothetical protein